MTDRARHAHATPDKLRYRPEVPLLRSTAPRRCPGGLLLPILAAALVAAPVTPARADSLQIDLQVNPERGFQVVQELSYEVIVVGTDGYLAELRLRVALHNASNRAWKGLGRSYASFDKAREHYRSAGVALPEPPFVDAVPIEFGIAEEGGNYHVPLVCTPWAYSTYRGS